MAGVADGTVLGVGVGVAAVGVSSGEADDAGGSKVGDAEGVGGGVEPQAPRMAAIAAATSVPVIDLRCRLAALDAPFDRDPGVAVIWSSIAAPNVA